LKSLVVLVLCLLILPLNAWWDKPDLPITSFDYGSPQGNVSPIAIGMGGLNLTNAADFYASYSNPALLGTNQYSLLAASFRVKGDDDMSIAEAAQFSNVLRPSQFKYVTLLAKQTAWTYQPMSAIYIMESPDSLFGYDGSFRYLDYQLDKWQVTLAGSDNSWQNLRFGLNAKYLTGRLVYLRSERPDTTFIDTKVKGFSSDLGVTLQTGDFTFGLAATDILSRLYWDWGYDSVPLQSHLALGAQYGTQNMTLSLGTQGKISQTPEPTYHLGFQYLWGWESSAFSSGQNVSQAFTLRAGLYSSDFYGIQNINYTLGAGYNYNVFRFDFAINNKGLRLRDSEYLFSLGLGLP